MPTNSVTDSPTYLSGKTDFKLDDHNDPPRSVVSIKSSILIDC